jgi:DNA-binding NtrC family response regulator
MDRQIRVLVVDDNPNGLALTRTYLDRVHADLTVETAVGGAEALDALEDPGGRVDCVVSDYDMPGLDGLDLLQAVRARTADLPFILFTGKTREEIASEATAAGLTDYLQKESGQARYEMLAARVETAVERRRTDQPEATESSGSPKR